MSFNSNTKKPKLIEPKLSKYYIEKNKQKELMEQIKKQDILKQEELSIQQTILPIPWYKIYILNLWNFIKENYGFFLIITLIIILLYVRYIEVNNRKNKMKKVLEQINKQNDIETEQ